ncbi:MAG: sporulation protein YqfD [Clostridia bacterium]|nr:sporulation protein YqfD [Clostridia bacterium]
MDNRFLYLRFSLHGLQTEKLLNAAKRENIRLRCISRKQDRTLICQCPKDQYPAFCDLCRCCGCHLTPLPPPRLSGMAFALCRNKWFLAGFLLFSFLIIYSLRLIWTVDILHAGPYEGDIRAYLMEQQIGPGTVKADIPLAKIQSHLEWRYPECAWIKVSFKGTSLQIEMTQGTLPPKMPDSDISGDVIAAQDGIVNSIVTFSGTPQVKPGDFIRKGQILILGEEKGMNGTTKPVRAQGQINARIWITQKAQISAWENLTLPTGNVHSRRVLHTPWGALSLTDKPDYTAYDLSVRHDVLGGTWFPLFISREKYEEIKVEKAVRSAEEVQKEAAQAAMILLERKLERNDVVVDKWVDYSMIEVESYAAEAVAEVLRDIGRFRAHHAGD